LFTPLLASWSGRRELMNLGQVELSGCVYRLEGNALLCAFYLNELLTRLLQRDDPYPKLYDLYQDTLVKLERNTLVESTLRYFEKNMLEFLGYGLPFDRELMTGLPLQVEKYYQYIPDRGFLLSESPATQGLVFKGGSLIALAAEDLSDEDSLRDAKRLLRYCVSRHLGDKPLKSRDLMV